jgi:predicted GIY-YIG superfamily endonuclease
MEYYCYLLYSPLIQTTYIGITNNLDRRIKEHNGILRGGAKSTGKASDWQYKSKILFQEQEMAASFEWYAKHRKNSNDKWVKTKGLDERLKRFDQLLEQENFQKAIKIL